MDAHQKQVVPQQGAVGEFPTFQPDDGETVVVKNIHQRADKKQHGRASKHGVLQFFETAQGAKFPDRQGVDVADVAVFIQDAIVAVVVIVVFCPILVRDKGQETTDGTYDVVRLPGGRERLVAAVVLDDKNPHQKEGIDDRERKSEPKPDIAQQVHGHPYCEEWQEGV